MSVEDDKRYFDFRKEGKIYISRLFNYGAHDYEGKRNVVMVMEGGDQQCLVEINGALCLRLSGEKRKTQVTAVVTQDEKRIRRLTLQTFKSRKDGSYSTNEKNEFTFRGEEFTRLCEFLEHIKFIDLVNTDNHQIEDISSNTGSKVIIDASDREIVERLKLMEGEQRDVVLNNLKSSLNKNDINILLGRKQGLAEYELQMKSRDWSETEWQEFFEVNNWVFGYGLDYRIMKQIRREATVGGSGTDNQNKPKVDFLMGFTDYTALVEIKRPDTKIFGKSRGGRAGTWQFSSEFIGAVSQILEQKAEWLSFSQSGEHYDDSGESVLKRTRNVKSFLVIGSLREFSEAENQREANLMRDTFELYRLENRSIEIITFDELLERAKFITQN